MYITGYFSSPKLDFYNSSGGIDLSFNRGTETNIDIFIAKYEPNGTISWARRIGGISEDVPISIVIDNTNVYITGYYSSNPLKFIIKMEA